MMESTVRSIDGDVMEPEMMTKLFVKAIVYGGGPQALAAVAYMIYLFAK